MNTPHLLSPAASTRPPGTRRVWLRAALGGIASAMLAACAAPPPPPPESARSKLDKALRAASFKPTEDGWEYSLTGKFLFDHDSVELDAESQAVADRLGRLLAILGVRTLRLEGHTDNVGSDAYNLALSLRRAQAVQRALTASGLHDAVIEVRGLGRAAQVTDNRTPEQRMQNRRVAVIVPGQ